MSLPRPGGPRRRWRVAAVLAAVLVVSAGGGFLAGELLSPADRPIQVTSDLAGFWSGSWAEVRKDMAGRYPKHHWPQDPTAG